MVKALGAFCALTLACGMAQAFPTLGLNRPFSLQPNFTTSYDFEGIVALSDCSGSFIRFTNSLPTDPGMVLTNGHCFEGGMLDAGQYQVNVQSQRSFDVFDAGGNDLGTIDAQSVMYTSMTKTDITLYQLAESYQQIEQQFNVQPLTLASSHPSVGEHLQVISGYWGRGYSCDLNGFVHELKESEWTWDDSIRYGSGCNVIPGTSGSPIVEAGTRQVIGINNTGNEDGQKCTLNNPCEIDANGNITYRKGLSYGQETYWIYSCLNSGRQIDLSRPGCQLFH